MPRRDPTVPFPDHPVPADPLSPLTAVHRQCAICGTHTAQGLAVHPACLDAARAPDAGLRAAAKHVARWRPSALGTREYWEAIDTLRAALASSPAPAETATGSPWPENVTYKATLDTAPAGFTLEEDVAVQPDDGPRDGLNKGTRVYLAPAPAGLDEFGEWVRWFLDANPNAEAGDLIDAMRERKDET